MLKSFFEPEKDLGSLRLEVGGGLDFYRSAENTGDLFHVTLNQNFVFAGMSHLSVSSRSGA